MIEFVVLTSGAEKIAQVDPHGWILTVVAVLIVFSVLLVLFGVYSLSGVVFSNKEKPAEGNGNDSGAIAAAIAVALELYKSDFGTSDKRITIQRRPSQWADKSLNFKKIGL